MRAITRYGAVLAAILMSVTALLGVAPRSAEAAGPLVLAFYYAWYDMNTWSSGQLPDLPSQTYASTDPSTIARHVGEAQSAGIDAFVQSWYGPGSGNQTEGNFQLLLDTASGRGFRAAIDFEVGSPYFAYSQDRISALQHLLSVHANHPAYLRVDGRPVVFFWASWLLSVDEWVEIRNQVDPERNSIWIVEGASLDYLSVFDGLHLYNIAWSDSPAGTLAYWGNEVRARSVTLGAYRYWAATVMPGWNDTLVPGRTDTFIRDRAGGTYYQSCWSGAVASGPDMIIITSFNEWAEGSTIEPSESYGDFYLNLTAQLAEAYKAGGGVPPPPPPQASPISEPDATALTPSPTAEVIAVNTENPRPTSTSWPDGSIIHVVESGDTLLGISDRYGVEMQTVLALNDLDASDLLWVGQLIVIQAANLSETLVTPTVTSTPTVTGSANETNGGWAAGVSEVTPTTTKVETPTLQPVIIMAPQVNSSASLTPGSSPMPIATRMNIEEQRSPGLCGGPLLLALAALWMGSGLRRD